jgi:hypothetical protein
MRPATASTLRLVLAVLMAILLFVPAMENASADDGVVYQYHPLGRVSPISPADCQITIYTYDLSGNLLNQSVQLGVASGCAFVYHRGKHTVGYASAIACAVCVYRLAVADARPERTALQGDCPCA